MRKPLSFLEYLDWLDENQAFLHNRKRQPLAVHPGKILENDFLKPQRLSQTELARRCGCTHAKINEIVHARRGITARFALQLEQIFGVSAEYWLSLQLNYDIARERRLAKEASHAKE